MKKRDKYLDIKIEIGRLTAYYNSQDNQAPSAEPDEARATYNSRAEKVFDSVIYEKYADIHRPGYTLMPVNYRRIPAHIRYYAQKYFKPGMPLSGSFPSWPYENSLESLRLAFLGKISDASGHYLKPLKWPDNKKYALILTHDIEDDTNWKWVRRIASVEMDYGLRSSWNVVPKLYRIDHAVLDWLAGNGFEIGLHDYNHDNKLAFLKEDKIRSRIEASLDLIRSYGIVGFRSGSWLRSERLFRVLQDYFLYDCSVLDVDYVSPAGVGGCCSVFPYSIGKLVELPTTLPYELPIQFGTKTAALNSFWEEKVRWIKSVGGMVNVITHPDPYYSGSDPMLDVYRDFLESVIKDREYTSMLPRDIAEYYIKGISR